MYSRVLAARRQCSSGRWSSLIAKSFASSSIPLDILSRPQEQQKQQSVQAEENDDWALNTNKRQHLGSYRIGSDLYQTHRNLQPPQRHYSTSYRRYFSKKATYPGKSRYLQRQQAPPKEVTSPNDDENFDEKFLKPAAEGRLRNKHSSGIPRLAARKPKARLEPVKGRSGNQIDWDSGSSEGFDSGGNIEDLLNKLEDGELSDDEDDYRKGTRVVGKEADRGNDIPRVGRPLDIGHHKGKDGHGDYDSDNGYDVEQHNGSGGNKLGSSRFGGKYENDLKAVKFIPAPPSDPIVPWRKRFPVNALFADNYQYFPEKEKRKDRASKHRGRNSNSRDDFDNDYEDDVDEEQDVKDEILKEDDSDAEYNSDDEFDSDSDMDYMSDDDDDEKSTTFNFVDEFDDEDALQHSKYAVPQFYENEKYYWHETDFDLLYDEEDPTFIKYIKPRIDSARENKHNKKPNLSERSAEKKPILKRKGKNDEDNYDHEGDEGESEVVHVKKFNKGDDVTMEELYEDQTDIVAFANQDPSNFPEECDNAFSRQFPISPLGFAGPRVIDFVDAMITHPTEYAQIVLKNPHSDGKREPKPIFTPHRRQPSLEFVKKYNRFLYVADMPALKVNGAVGDLDNPIHALQLQKVIAELFDVDVTQVYGASTTSAFIGYHTPRDLYNAIQKGPTNDTIVAPCAIERFTDAGLVKDFDGSKGQIVKVEGFKPGYTSFTLLENLIYDNPELNDVYGNTSPNDVYFLSNNSALIRFGSKEQSDSAAESSALQGQLQLLSTFPVRYFRARRELVHIGRTGYRKTEEIRRMGPQLIVDGEMPKKDLFLTHAQVIQLRGLPIGISKEELTDILQPYSSRLRDTEGSIEIVECEVGIPSGVAYAGFESRRDAKEFVTSHSGKILIDDKIVHLKMVKERIPPGKTLYLPSVRSERTDEELLDDLHNWEKHVDPQDIEDLKKFGVSKDVLDDVFRTIRFRNEYFGSLDNTVRDDAIEPEKQNGQLYKEMVQLYIKTLIECGATPEEPDEGYLMMTYPGEEVDMAPLYEDLERVKKVQESRKNPNI